MTHIILISVKLFHFLPSLLAIPQLSQLGIRFESRLHCNPISALKTPTLHLSHLELKRIRSFVRWFCLLLIRRRSLPHLLLHTVRRRQGQAARFLELRHGYRFCHRSSRAVASQVKGAADDGRQSLGRSVDERKSRVESRRQLRIAAIFGMQVVPHGSAR